MSTCPARKNSASSLPSSPFTPNNCLFLHPKPPSFPAALPLASPLALSRVPTTPGTGDRGQGCGSPAPRGLSAPARNGLGPSLQAHPRAEGSGGERLNPVPRGARAGAGASAPGNSVASAPGRRRLQGEDLEVAVGKRRG